MLEGEAGILRELLIATKEVRESALPGGTECVLAEGERRLEEYIAFLVVVSIVDQGTGNRTVIAALSNRRHLCGLSQFSRVQRTMPAEPHSLQLP